MKRLGVILLALVMMGMSFAVTRAQEALTQTFNSADGSFSFMYPAGWSAEEQEGFVVFSNSPEIMGSDATGAGFLVYKAFTGALEDAPSQSLGDLVASDYKTYPKKDLQINGHNAVQYSTSNASAFTEVFAIDAGNGKALVAAMGGKPDQASSLEPTFQAVLASFQFQAKAGADLSAPTVTPSGAPNMPADAVNPQARIALDMPNGTGHALVITDVNGQTTKIVNRAADIDAVKWSHDSAKLAFLSQPDQNRPSDFELFITDAEGNQVQPVTQPPAPISAFAWSPDDTQLLFEVTSTATADSLESGIYTVNVDGSNLSKLALDPTVGGLSGGALDWSPDGKRILFSVLSKDTNQSKLYFADADGSHVTSSPSTASNPTAALWSPDGQRLLIRANDLVVENVDGTQTATIVGQSENWAVGGISWSPDGAQVAFGITANKNGAKVIFLADADGFNRRTINLGQDIDTSSVSWANDAAVSAIPPTATQPPATTTSFTATNGKYTVGAQVPTNATVSDSSSASGAQIKINGLSTVGYDATITYPLHVDGNNDPFAILAGKSSSPQQTITDIRVDGHKAGRLDVPSDSDSSQQNVTFLVLLDESSNDLLEVAFTLPADHVDALDSAMTALVESVTITENAATTPTEATPAAPVATAEVGSDITSTVACAVTANSTANLRSGPGTSFAKAGSLAAGVTQSVTGQATGSDGKVWYQLGSSYVRSDLVRADGDCASVPTVSP